MTNLRTSILLIGDELLVGDIADQNGPFLAERLTEQGFLVQTIKILSDDTKAIAEVVIRDLSECRLVVLCGGLGPTPDDRTTEAIATAFHRELVLDKEQWEKIRQLFLSFSGEEPSPGNEKQATIPEGADILHNENGAALGYVVCDGDRAVAVLPGPPRENRPMFEQEMLPWLEKNIPERSLWVSKVFRVFGLSESEIGYRLRRLEDENKQLRVSYRFSPPEILVKLRCRSESIDVLTGIAGEVERLLEPNIYTIGDEQLPSVLGRILADRGMRIVTAESCTGGLAAKLLTDTAGSSAWMEHGFVAYTDAAKEAILQVPKELLERYGAVSEPVAKAMLEGALKGASAHAGFAITGIAGPAGGTGAKPVGTICIAWGDRRQLHSDTHHFYWDREHNRLFSAWAAMYQLYQYLLSQD